jgi:hypothetical protein
MSQMIERLTQPVLILSWEAFFQGILKDSFTELHGNYFWEGFRIVVSTNLEKDVHITTLTDMHAINQELPQ